MPFLPIFLMVIFEWMVKDLSRWLWVFVCFVEFGLVSSFCNFVNYSVKSLRSRHLRIANMNTLKPEASISERPSWQVCVCLPVTESELWTSAGCRWQQPVTQLRVSRAQVSQCGVCCFWIHGLYCQYFGICTISVWLFHFNTILILLSHVSLICILVCNLYDFAFYFWLSHSYLTVVAHFAGNLHKLLFDQRHLHQHTSHTENLFCPSCQAQECSSPSVEPLFWLCC